MKIMVSGPITSWEIDVETVSDFIFGGSKITADVDCSHEIERRLLLGRKVTTNLDSIFKSRDIANKGPSSQGYGFSSGHVCMWELDCEESWVPKNWCCWTVVLEKTLRIPWTARGSNQSILKEISPGCSLEGMMLKLKLQYFGHLMWSWLIGKDSDAGRDWGQEEKGTTEDEMAGCHHWLDGCEFGWTPGVGDGQGGLACCNSWVHKESVLHIRWPKYWSFRLCISPSNEYSGLISFRIDWLDLLAVKGIL